MKIGLIARADNSGLGMQTWEFYNHMHPEKTMVVDISKFNNNPVFPHRYPERAVFVSGIPTPNQVDQFLEGLDVVFIAEAAYNPYLYVRAKELGVKTAVQYNYEFFDWFGDNTPLPDMFIAPSKWHYQEVDTLCKLRGVKHVYLHCPVAREKLPKREITQARNFLHVAGRAAAHDRNGTKTVIAATKYLTTAANIVVHFQGEQGLKHQATDTFYDYQDYASAFGDYSKLSMVKQELLEYQDIYAMGEVLLLPRRYGGNCLPMNEALSVGMPVIMTDISPNNEFLPKEWLLPAMMVDQFKPRTVVDIYGADPQALAARIDIFYNLASAEMAKQNDLASLIARSISWEVMAPKYREILQELCSQ